MDELGKLKNSMEQAEKEMEKVKGKYEKLNQRYKQMKAKKDEIEIKEYIKILEKKVEEQIQKMDEKEILLEGCFFPPLIQLENLYKRVDEYEKAEKTHQKRDEIYEKVVSKEYILKKIKCMEEEIENNKKLDDDERERIWYYLKDFYMAVNEVEKAKEAEKRYKYLHDHDCFDDILRH